MATQVAEGQLFRSRDAVVGGVCAGIAEHFELDPIVVRILFVLGSIVTFGVAAICYLVLWARLPIKPQVDFPYDVKPESAESNTFGSVDCETGRASGERNAAGATGASMLARLAVAVGLMLLFLGVSMNLSPMMMGTEWWQFWPLALLIIGLCIIIIPVPMPFETAWHAFGVVVTTLAATMLPISLGIMSWDTLPIAFSHGWFIVVIAAALFAFGLYRKSKALVIIAAFVFVMFCLYALLLCSLPGAMNILTLHLPDGSLVKVSLIDS